ncbi:nucleotidyltransferase domain-containing protein [Candidatus Woesearchaeota archaeon]|nr:nucleotidyltransferase domain-containing protein [Candidatus Woesearchaeota archaeon]
MKPIVNKKYQKLLIETGLQKVLEVFYKYPEKEFSLSDLAKEARIAKPHVGRILDTLQKHDLIGIVKLSKIWRIKANTDSWMFIKLKIVYNLNFIYQSGILEYLNDHFRNPHAIVLFGSFRKGEDVSTSDIDLAIEVEEEGEYQSVRLTELEGFEKTIGRQIQLHLFNRKNVDLHVFNNIANGMVLLGFLEVQP